MTEITTGVAVHLARGLHAGYTGARERELAEYRRAVALAPKDPVARHGLASALFRSRDFEAAAADFRHALRLDPDNPNYRYDLGLALLRTDSVDEAAASFRAALKLDPAYKDAALMLAELELQHGSSAEVLRLVDEILRLEPGATRARTLRLMAYLKQGRRSVALQELRTLLAEYPPSEPVERLRLATLLAGLGDPGGARQQIAAVAELAQDPKLRAQAHLALGQLSLAGGEVDAAAAEFRQALELDPGLEAARAGLSATLLRKGEPG